MFRRKKTQQIDSLIYDYYRAESERHPAPKFPAALFQEHQTTVKPEEPERHSLAKMAYAVLLAALIAFGFIGIKYQSPADNRYTMIFQKIDIDQLLSAWAEKMSTHMGNEQS